MSSGQYSDREKELIFKGYDPDEAILIAADERGAEQFYEEMGEEDDDE